jgi:hypothetical protein
MKHRIENKGLEIEEIQPDKGLNHRVTEQVHYLLTFRPTDPDLLAETVAIYMIRDRERWRESARS